MIRLALVIIGLGLCAWKFTGAYLAAETIRTEGEVILFELAPVDPRELFLGDYMTLNYDLGFSGDSAAPAPPIPSAQRAGTAVFTLEDGVATISRFENVDNLSENERRVRYTINNQAWQARIAIGGDRYYFQSGTVERFEDAAYGIFRVMPDGRALLSGLADEKKRPILIAGEAPFKSVSD
jgi:uncharacterized membrane-anchored protein